jgi:hypothetical protein
MRLVRYWITFHPETAGDARLPGCGVTAWSAEDAFAILGETVFRGRSLPPVATLTEDVDVSTLDAGHVLPNMLPPVWRGVWFPIGFADSEG